MHIALEFGGLLLNAKYGQRTIIKRPHEVSFEELPGSLFSAGFFLAYRNAGMTS